MEVSWAIERECMYQRLSFVEEVGDESGRRFGRLFGREEFGGEIPENDHANDSGEAKTSLLSPLRLRCSTTAFNYCCRRRRHLRQRERERESDGIEDLKRMLLVLVVVFY